MGVSGRGRGRGATALIFIALFALLAGAIVGVAFRKVLVVKSVEIVGLEGEEADAVRALAGIRLGQSILDVDSREISINMRENGYIKLCGVEVVKPDKVVITVSRREKAAAFEHLGFTYIVDAELSVLECTGGLSDAGVMIITGAAVQHTPVGMPINIDAGKGAMIRQLLCAIEEAGLTSSISELNVANAQSIYMVMRSRYVFRLGDASSLEEKLHWVRPMEERLASEGRASGTVDVSSVSAADYMPPQATPTASPSPYALATFQPFEASPEPFATPAPGA